jgi:protein TonB
MNQDCFVAASLSTLAHLTLLVICPVPRYIEPGQQGEASEILVVGVVELSAAVTVPTMEPEEKVQPEPRDPEAPAPSAEEQLSPAADAESGNKHSVEQEPRDVAPAGEEPKKGEPERTEPVVEKVPEDDKPRERELVEDRSHLREPSGLRPREKPAAREPETASPSPVPKATAAPSSAPLAEASSPGQDDLPGDRTVSQGATISVRREYLSAVLRRIHAAKRYPRRARWRAQEGAVEITFTIVADGAVEDVRLTRRCRFPLLDHEAVAIIHRASPFPPIPPKLSKSKWRLTVPIRFELRGRW